MARKKRSTLPAITDADHTHRPDMLRRTATGWAWKCAYCGQFACSETQAGKYVCRAHGGVTARQRDPEARHHAREAGKPLSRAPGRPIRSGFYSRNQVRIDDLVAKYQARRLDADATDDDMYHLRAYLEVMRQGWGGVAPLRGPLTRLTAALHPTDEDEVNAVELTALVREVRQLLRVMDRSAGGLERRHERLIRLAKVRAETRVKNSVANQLEAFTIMLERMKTIFEETLPHEHHMALMARFKKELDELPRSVVDGTGSIEA